jgi:hypothetical protein
MLAPDWLLPITGFGFTEFSVALVILLAISVVLSAFLSLSFGRTFFKIAVPAALVFAGIMEFDAYDNVFREGSEVRRCLKVHSRDPAGSSYDEQVAYESCNEVLDRHRSS